MSVPVIEMKGVKKTFRDFWLRPLAEAVRGIDLTVEKGDVFGLLGPNGSGKSTTIKLLLGLLAPSAGEIRLFGLPPRARAARARLGYLPELSHLHPFLTARETILYYAGLSGLSGGTARARADELLEQVGLTAVAARAVGGFSKGMARRVALASSLVSRPELLVLDEPTSGLDPIGTREVKDLIRRLSGEGVTILMSSHLLGDSEDVCSKLAILSGGRVAACGRTVDLLTRTQDARFTIAGMDEDAARAFAAETQARLGRPVVFDHPSVPLEDFFAETVGAK
ncbi:MAG: ABC transporter ATP-binding protein [Kiritimatiellia bacterium]